jgi:hypothetical protein
MEVIGILALGGIAWLAATAADAPDLPNPKNEAVRIESLAPPIWEPTPVYSHENGLDFAFINSVLVHEDSGAPRCIEGTVFIRGLDTVSLHDGMRLLDTHPGIPSAKPCVATIWQHTTSGTYVAHFSPSIITVNDLFK